MYQRSTEVATMDNTNAPKFKAEINGKVFKDGNSYAIRIKKALVEAKILEEGKNYKFICEIVQDNSPVVKSWLHHDSLNSKSDANVLVFNA